MYSAYLCKEHVLHALMMWHNIPRICVTFASRLHLIVVPQVGPASISVYSLTAHCGSAPSAPSKNEVPYKPKYFVKHIECLHVSLTCIMILCEVDLFNNVGWFFRTPRSDPYGADSSATVGGLMLIPHTLTM